MGLLDIIAGVTLGLSDNGKKEKDKNTDTDYLMPWEQDLVDNNEYEPYHFEEDDTEEDDYYHEDDF